MQPISVSRTVVKPHNRKTALDQPVDRHDNQLLHLKIRTEESDCRIGIGDQKKVYKSHHKRTKGIHNKRRQSKGENTANQPLLQMKSFDLYPHFLLFAQQQGKCQNHG